MQIKLVRNFIGVIGVGCLLNERLRQNIDRNIARPIRNYRATLNDYNSFRTPEDMARFGRELGNGLLNLVRFEEKYD